MHIFDIIYKASLIATLFALIWYAWETRKIRIISKEQKDLQLLPAIMIYIRRQSGSERPFIRNIGTGTAVGVDILKSAVENGRLVFKYHLVDNNNTLISQEERQVGVNLWVDGNQNDSPLENFLAYYDPANLQMVRAHREAGDISSSTPLRRELRIRFKDILGQKYETKIRFGDNGIVISSSPKRI